MVAASAGEANVKAAMPTAMAAAAGRGIRATIASALQGV
jgi:hypothetical protein